MLQRLLLVKAVWASPPLQVFPSSRTKTKTRSWVFVQMLMFRVSFDLFTFLKLNLNFIFGVWGEFFHLIKRFLAFRLNPINFVKFSGLCQITTLISFDSERVKVCGFFMIPLSKCCSSRLCSYLHSHFRKSRDFQQHTTTSLIQTPKILAQQINQGVMVATCIFLPFYCASSHTFSYFLNLHVIFYYFY